MAYEESLESWTKRLKGELKDANDYTPQFSSKDPFELRHHLRFMRKSLEKCNMYLSYMEGMVEKMVSELPPVIVNKPKERRTSVGSFDVDELD